MPTPSQLAREGADEVAREAYFDLTIHPSEAGTKGAALLDEYLKAVAPRIETAMLLSRQSAMKELAEKVLGAVPEQTMFKARQTCTFHGDFKCEGCTSWNAARTALIKALEEAGVNVG